jgi:anti-anti-sigma factor
MAHEVEIGTDPGSGRAVLMLRGAFDVRTTSEVRQAIYDHIVGRDEDLVVDMSQVEVVDLTALRLLAVATRQAAKRERHLTLRGCGPTVRRMLHLTRLARAIEVERAAATA